MILPVVILESSEDSTDKVILNISSPSTILSLLSVIFTVLILLPATIVMFTVVELKSVLLPEIGYMYLCEAISNYVRVIRFNNYMSVLECNWLMSQGTSQLFELVF